MGQSLDPHAISFEWLEQRYGCAAQDIFEEIVRADAVANDSVCYNNNKSPEAA